MLRTKFTKHNMNLRTTATNFLKITRILHAGYIFEYNNKKIVFDPVLTNPFSRNCYAYPPVKFNLTDISAFNPDAIFISHVHDDHLCLESLSYLNRDIPIYLYAFDEIYFQMIKKLGFNKVFKLTLDKSVEMAPDFKVTPRLALDADVDTVFQIQMGEMNVLNVVDSWIDPVALKFLSNIKKWDMILWPFQTLRELQVLDPRRSSKEKEIPFEWAEQLKILNPRIIVPSSCQFIHESWSWYNQQLFPISYSEFQQWCFSVLPATSFLRMDPGKSFEISDKDILFKQDLNFLKLTSNEVVDYHYNPDMKIPSIGQIVENLNPLSLSEKNAVIDFCHNQLRKKFNQISDQYPDDFCWRLYVWENQDSKFIFDFSKHEGTANNWQTDISIQKLYSALNTGETLTSLYLRINDCEFPQNIEKRNSEMDILSDPLISILFQNNQHQYHMDQLKNLGRL